MPNVLRRLPLFDSDPEMLREISAEYAEIADFCEREGFTAVASTLRILQHAYDPSAPLSERNDIIKGLGEGLIEQSRVTAQIPKRTVSTVH